MLCSAAYAEYKKSCKGSLVNLSAGQVLYGRPEWSRRLGIPEGKLRSVVDILLQDGMITIQVVGRRYSIITIVNWETYQSKEDFDSHRDFITDNISNETTNASISNIEEFKGIDNQQINQQKTNGQPNKKNIKNNKNTYTAEFEIFYSTYPRPEDKRRTFNNWTTCLKTYTPDQLIQAAINYKKKKSGTELQFLKSSANFLGREKPFEDYLSLPEYKKTTAIDKNEVEDVPEFFMKANGYDQGGVE